MGIDQPGGRSVQRDRGAELGQLWPACRSGDAQPFDVVNVRATVHEADNATGTTDAMPAHAVTALEETLTPGDAANLTMPALG